MLERVLLRKLNSAFHGGRRFGGWERSLRLVRRMKYGKKESNAEA